MTFIEQPKTEGETKDCPSCKAPLVARLKQYKDWPDKILWQNKDKTEAHYDKDGNCKGSPSETVVTQDSILETRVSSDVEKVETTTHEIPEVNENFKEFIQENTIELLQIEKEVKEMLGQFYDQVKIKRFEEVGKIGMMIKELYRESKKSKFKRATEE